MAQVSKSTKSTKTRSKSNFSKYSKTVSVVKPKNKKQNPKLPTLQGIKPSKKDSKKSVKMIKTKAAKTSESEIHRSASFDLSLPALDMSDISSEIKAAESVTENTDQKKNTTIVEKKANRRAKRMICAIIAAVACILIICTVAATLFFQLKKTYDTTLETSIKQTTKRNQSTIKKSTMKITSKSTFSNLSSKRTISSNTSSSTKYKNSTLKATSKATTLSTSQHPSTLPPTPGSLEQLPNMTKSCRQKYGMCFAARSLYRSQCHLNTVCMSLHLQPKLIKNRDAVKLTFVYNENEWEEDMDTEPYTPCNSVPNGKGWCLNGTCQTLEYEKHRTILQQYDNLKRTTGGWGNVEPNGEKCLKDFSKDDSLMSVKVDWDKYLKLSSSDIVLRTCTNPPPLQGGRPCWNILDNVEDWPLFIPQNCSRCREPLLECNLASDKDYKDPCRLDSKKFTNGMADTDFKPCCYKVATTYRKGRCFLGSCIPVKKF